MNWPRLALQILSSIAGGVGAANLGRLTTPDAGAGPLDLAGWVGIPAALAAAGAVGQHFLRSPAVDGKPGSPGHSAFCQSVYDMAKACEWDKLVATVQAWQKTSPEAPKP